MTGVDTDNGTGTNAPLYNPSDRSSTIFRPEKRLRLRRSHAASRAQGGRHYLSL